MQYKTGFVKSSDSVADDNVFASERGPSPSMLSASNLDSHPRAQIIREGFYQSPRLQPVGYTPGNYDFPPSRRSGKSLSGSGHGGRLSLSTLSINRPSVTRRKQ